MLSPVDSSDIIMRIPRWLVVLGPLISGLVALFAWSVRPVPYKYAIKQSDSTLVDATESTPGARPVLGASSHVLPFTQTRDVVERIAKHADLTWDEATQARAADVIAKRLAWKKKAYYRTDEFGLSRTAISERLGTVCDHYRNSMSSRYIDPFKDPDYVCREPGDCIHESLRSK